MRTPTVTGAAALAERMVAKAQVDASIPEAAMPSYLDMFLAHLRLLIGVPFAYLVPDSRLLPDESIRFFYLDRSWTDRLVDGALAVGKIGTREQAHHQAHAADVQATLDQTERMVRSAQTNHTPAPTTESAGTITGFLLRSAAVSGWPTMDVRAFSTIVPPPPTTGDDAAMTAWRASADAVQLPTLRLERLSPSVLLALFDGVPALVWCEEPHQMLPFTFQPRFTHLEQLLLLDRRMASGATEPSGGTVAAPVRAANGRVIAVQELRNRLNRLGDAQLVPQTGSAAFAIECMGHPWRQRFQHGAGAVSTTGPDGPAAGAFVPARTVAQRVTDPDLQQAVDGLTP
jgi:hypothetical protein